MEKILYAAIVSFLITLVLTPIAIPILRKLKFGQSIREIGPSWHNSKAGTPTMGGITFIVGITAATLIFGGVNYKTALVLMGSVGFGVVGLMDDYIKIALKRNLGLKAWQKLVLQLIVAIVFIVFGQGIQAFDSSVFIPFGKFYFDLGQLFIPAAVFIIIGTVNSVNLTDGVDGLASSVTGVCMVFFMVLSYTMWNQTGLADPVTYIFAGACVGGLVGFLVYNAYPAKIFMGDTGSLFLGGAVSVLAFMLKNPLILVLVGIIYFIESLSVIIQVTCFKITGKRFFRMSPIHHHFEMCGWSENKIVTVFSVVTGVLALVSIYAII